MYRLKLKIKTLEALQEAINSLNVWKKWYMIEEEDGTRRIPNPFDDNEETALKYQAYEDAADFIATMAMNFGK